MKNAFIAGALALALLVGGVWWSKSLSGNEPGIISRNGLHYHPQLEIYVQEEKVIIPEGVGLGAVHLPMHTHDDLPIIHLEFSGVVTRDDVRLGNFFKNWGRDMQSFGKNMRMIVNGVPNIEYENYELKDGDIVELRYD